MKTINLPRAVRPVAAFIHSERDEIRVLGSNGATYSFENSMSHRLEGPRSLDTKFERMWIESFTSDWVRLDPLSMALMERFGR